MRLFFRRMTNEIGLNPSRYIGYAAAIASSVVSYYTM